MSKQVSGWKQEPELRRISNKTIDRVEMFLDLSDKPVSLGHIFLTLKMDYKSLKRIVAVMVRCGVVEVMETNSITYYRKVR